MEIGSKYLDKEENKSKSESIKVKLPKLVTSRFEDTVWDWFCFCNHLERVIDKQDISPVTEFSYLEDFLFLLVCKLIEGLSLPRRAIPELSPSTMVCLQ